MGDFNCIIIYHYTASIYNGIPSDFKKPIYFKAVAFDK